MTVALFQDSKPITDTNEGSITEKLDEVITSDLLQTMRDFRQKLSAGDMDMTRETDKEAGQAQDAKTPGYLSMEEFAEKVSGRVTDMSKELPKEDDRAMDAQSLFARDFGFNEEEFLRKSPEYTRNIREKENDKRTGDEVERLRENEFSEMFVRFTDADVYTLWGEGPNCYAFAMNMPVHPLTGEKFSSRPCMGEISGYTLSDNHMADLLKYGSEEQVKETLVDLWKKDCAAMGKELIEVSSGDYVPKEGELLTALMYGNEDCVDFHFMRKGDYGLWYHKPGLADPTLLDNSGRYIRDPKDCDRGIYNHFCGYFVIRNKEVS